MTAEVAIMNKEAIALAADSAVTLSGLTDSQSKVLTSANKIFAVSKYEPVAAMIYGNAHLMGVPWEGVVKLFREELGRKGLATVEDYAKSFINFLHQHKRLFPDAQRNSGFARHLASYYRSVKDRIESEASHRFPSTKSSVPSEVDRRAVAQELIASDLASWKAAEFLPLAANVDVKSVRSQFGPLISKLIDGVFVGIPLPNSSKRALREIGCLAMLKCPKDFSWSSESGLVISGYGREEFFPALHSFSVFGVYGDHLNYKCGHSAGIGFEHSACIIPFAQGDAVYTFMEGVDPAYQYQIQVETAKLIRGFPEAVINSANGLNDQQKSDLLLAFKSATEPLLKDYFKGLDKYRTEKFSSEIVDLVSFLPKSELAVLAESMVNLTSLRRKVSRGLETVGGPIDVAVISKGDGLVWIKRKNYFDPDLNHRYFANYHREQVSNYEKIEAGHGALVPKSVGISNGTKTSDRKKLGNRSR
jgi:hypothetical protein